MSVIDLIKSVACAFGTSTKPMYLIRDDTYIKVLTKIKLRCGVKY